MKTSDIFKSKLPFQVSSSPHVKQWEYKKIAKKVIAGLQNTEWILIWIHRFVPYLCV